MYCPDKKPNKIVSIIEHIKSLLHPTTPSISGGDFNINLLDVTTDLAIYFLNNLHTYSLHPIIYHFTN